MCAGESERCRRAVRGELLGSWCVHGHVELEERAPDYAREAFLGQVDPRNNKKGGEASIRTSNDT